MRLDVVVYSTGTWWARPWEEAFVRGLDAHGIRAEPREQSCGRVSDLAVIWSHHNLKLFEMQRQAGRDYLVMERGYVGDRYAWTALCFNGLNGRAQWLPSGGPSRWHHCFGHCLREWRTDGDYALVCGQVPGDASIAGVNIERWVAEQCEALLDQGHRVRYRPHPQYGGRVCPPGVELSTGSLEQDLAGAAFVVTYNSNSATDAVLAGVPAVTMDAGSMAWSVSTHDPAEPLWRGDRSGWAEWLAWCQWSEHEIRSGAAWEFLRQRYDH